MTEPEVLHCIRSPAYFIAGYCMIEDKASGNAVPFLLYPRQVDVLRDFEKYDRCLVLKARQLGLTTEAAGYALHRCCTKPMFAAHVVAQSEKDAFGFVDRVRFMYRRLPDELRPPLKSDTAGRIEFGGELQSSIEALPATASAGHGLTSNLVIIDEADRVPNLNMIMQALEPTLEHAGGRMILLTTAHKPGGDFHELWLHAPERWKRIFLDWRAHPKRDQAWYAREAADHLGDPSYMARNYPNTPEEAFMASGDRCFPKFSRARNVKTLKELDLQHAIANTGIGIDWGASNSAFVVVWLMNFPTLRPGFTVDPSCKNTIREFETWGRDEDGEPADGNHHCVDAIRYGVVHTPPLTGHIHVVDELYVERAASKGHDVLSLAKLTKDRNGGRQIDRGVADCHEPLSIRTFMNLRIPVVPYKKFESTLKNFDMEQCIRHLGALIASTGTFRIDEVDPKLALIKKLDESRNRNVFFSDEEKRMLREVQEADARQAWVGEEAIPVWD